MIRKKFRDSIIKFCKEVQSGERQQLPALEALRQFKDERRRQLLKLNELKYSSGKLKKNLLTPQVHFETESSSEEGDVLEAMARMIGEQQETLKQITEIVKEGSV